jgi:hypothetical protein
VACGSKRKEEEVKGKEGQRKTNGSSGPKRGGRGGEGEEEGEREEEGEDRDVEDTREGAKMKLSFFSFGSNRWWKLFMAETRPS